MSHRTKNKKRDIVKICNPALYICLEKRKAELKGKKPKKIVSFTHPQQSKPRQYLAAFPFNDDRNRKEKKEL